MAKNWENIFNNSIGSTTKKTNKNFEKMMKEKPMTFDELKKQGESLYLDKIAQEDHIVALYEEKKLKSKNLIKKARDIKAKREEQEEKEKAEKTA
jgi:outer membrane cobalamin receptor